MTFKDKLYCIHIKFHKLTIIILYMTAGCVALCTDVSSRCFGENYAETSTGWTTTFKPTPLSHL